MVKPGGFVLNTGKNQFTRLHYYKPAIKPNFQAHLHKCTMETDVLYGEFDNVLGGIDISSRGKHPVFSKQNKYKARKSGNADFVEIERVRYKAGDSFFHPTDKYHYLEFTSREVVTICQWSKDPYFIDHPKNGVIGEMRLEETPVNPREEVIDRLKQLNILE